MKLIFKEIDRENWEECADLTVLREQEKYISLNCYSMLRARFEEVMVIQL